MPCTSLINHYAGEARMGQHRDQDERAREPVVSLSIGAPCVFRFGNPESRGKPWTDVELRAPEPDAHARVPTLIRNVCVGT